MSQRLYPPARPQSIGEVLDAAFQILAASLVRTLPYGILLIIAGQLGSIYNLATGRPVGRAAPTDVQAIVVYILSAIAVLVLWAALLLRQRATAQGERNSMRVELTYALQRLQAMAGLSLLMLLAIVVGALCLVLPGVYLCIALSMAQPLVVFERKGPIDAMKLSVQLVRGSWWRTLVIFLVAIAIVFVIYILAIVVAAIILRFARGADVALLSAAVTVLIIALGAFSTPFLAATQLAVFGDLQVRHAAMANPRT